MFPKNRFSNKIFPIPSIRIISRKTYGEDDITLLEKNGRYQLHLENKGEHYYFKFFLDEREKVMKEFDEIARTQKRNRETNHEDPTYRNFTWYHVALLYHELRENMPGDEIKNLDSI